MLDKVAMSAMLDRRVMVVVGFAQKRRLSKVQLWRSSIGKRLGKEKWRLQKTSLLNKYKQVVEQYRGKKMGKKVSVLFRSSIFVIKLNAPCHKLCLI